MSDIVQMIADASSRYDVPPSLALEVAYAESGLNPNVPDGAAGEIGIMQLLPSTAAQYGLSPDDARDPEQNIDAGVHYLADLLTEFGDPATAVAAYNAGPGNVARGRIPASTKSYVAKVLERAATGYKVEAMGPFDMETLVIWAALLGFFALVFREAT